MTTAPRLPLEISAVLILSVVVYLVAVDGSNFHLQKNRPYVPDTYSQTTPR